MGSKRFEILFESAVDTSTAEKNIQEIQKLFEKTELEITPSYNQSVFNQISKNIQTTTNALDGLQSKFAKFSSGGIEYTISQDQAFTSNGSKYWQPAQIQYANQQQAIEAGLENLETHYQTLKALQESLNKAIEVGNSEIEAQYKNLVQGLESQTSTLENTLTQMGADINIAPLQQAKALFEDSKIAESLARTKTEAQSSSNALKQYTQLLGKRNKAEVELHKVNLQLADSNGENEESLFALKSGLQDLITIYNNELSAVKENITTTKDKEQANFRAAESEKELQNELVRTNSAMKEQESWSTKIVNAIKSQLGTLSTFALVQKGFQAITWAGTQAITTIRELDKSMTDIQTVTSGTAAETQKLFQQYNQLAKEIGSTTAAVASGAGEWLRQGRTAEDTEMLLRQSAIFAKVGALEAEEATTQLTAVLNGFKMGAEDASHVVDALSMVDLKAATSTKELSEALQYTSNSARTAGVDFEQLVGMIGAISEATRLSSSIIGNAFKTLFARFSNIAAGKTIDDFGESINDVESVLRGVGIEIREDADHFREAYDVFEDVAEQWSKFNDSQRNQIATAIAGTRQREIWIALMENWERAKELMDVAANSTGASAEKFNIYLDSIEAKLNTLKATFEGLIKSEFTTNLFKAIIDSGTILLNVIDEIVNGPGGIALLSGGIYLLLDIFKDATIAISGFTTAFSLSPFGIAVAIAAGVYGIAKAIEFVTERTERYTEELEKTNSILADTQSKVVALESRNDLTEAEQKYLEVLKEEVKELEERKKLEEERVAQSGAKDRAWDSNKDFAALQALYDEQSTIETGRYGTEGSQGYNEAWKSNIEAIEEAKESLIQYGLTIYDIEKAQGELYQSDQEIVDQLKELGLWEEVVARKTAEAASEIVDMSDAFDEAGNTISTLNDSLEETEESTANIVADFQHLSEALIQIDDVQAEIDKTGVISLDTLDQLLDKYPQLTEQVNLYLMGLASTEDVMRALQEAYAIDEENAYNNIVSKLKMNEDYYTYLKQLDADLIRQFNEDYGIDLDNHVTYDQGKEQIETALVNEFNRIWKEHFGMMAEGFTDMESALSTLSQYQNTALYDSSSFTRLRGLADKYKSAMKDWEAVYDNSFVINLTNQYQALGTAARDAASAARSAGDAANRAAQRAAEQAKKQQEDYYNKLVELTVKMLKKEKELEKERLKDQLEGYKKLIDAQEKLLDKQDEQYKHDRELQDKNKTISQLEGQIAELQFDTSAEGVKKRLLLEEELAEKKRDLEDYQHDYSIDQQKDALKEEEERYSEAINAQIKEIDRWLSETGKIYAEARRLIDEHADATLQKLLEYNSIWGSETSATIRMWWEGAVAAVDSYISAVQAAAYATMSMPSYSGGGGGGGWSTPEAPSAPTKANLSQTPTNVKHTTGASVSGTKAVASSGTSLRKHHRGLDSGFVGGLKGNEEFVKALKGEVFVTKAQQDKFMQKILPNMAKNGRSNVQNSPSNVNFKTLLELTVNGNMNKDMLPELEQIVQKAVKELNKTMFMSGNVKSTRSVSI